MFDIEILGKSKNYTSIAKSGNNGFNQSIGIRSVDYVMQGDHGSCLNPLSSMQSKNKTNNNLKVCVSFLFP